MSEERDGHVQECFVLETKDDEDVPDSSMRGIFF